MLSDDGYSFNVKLVGKNDIVINYNGIADNLDTIIKVLSTTENSIQV